MCWNTLTKHNKPFQGGLSCARPVTAVERSSNGIERSAILFGVQCTDMTKLLFWFFTAESFYSFSVGLWINSGIKTFSHDSHPIIYILLLTLIRCKVKMIQYRSWIVASVRYLCLHTIWPQSSGLSPAYFVGKGCCCCPNGERESKGRRELMKDSSMGSRRHRMEDLRFITEPRSGKKCCKSGEWVSTSA